MLLLSYQLRPHYLLRTLHSPLVLSADLAIRAPAEIELAGINATIDASFMWFTNPRGGQVCATSSSPAPFTLTPDTAAVLRSASVQSQLGG